MPLFHYKAQNGEGKKISGLIEASDEKEAKERIKSQGMLLIAFGLKEDVSSRQNLYGETLVNFTQQLAQLITAGVPLYESLVTLEEQYRGEACHRIILSLCEEIKRGTPLSSAMQRFPGSFDSLYLAMIRAGEASGALSLVLERLGELLQARLRLKNQITTAMIYPCILGGFCLVIICVLVGFVVPSIESIFEGRELNTFTQVVLSVSYFFRTYFWIFIPLIGLIIFLLYLFFRTDRGKIWIAENSLRTPVLKGIVIKAAIARFSKTIYTLLVGGVPIIEALRTGRGVMGNSVLEEEMQRVEQKIVEGSSFGKELLRSHYFPKIVGRMLRVGEESGSFPQMLGKVADMYGEDVARSLERLVALMQPVILLFLGTVIGTILLAILLPMTDMGSFIG